MRARPQRAYSRQRAHWRAALTPRPCRVFSIAGVLEHSYRKFAVDNGWFDPDEYLRLSEQGIGAAIVRACRHGPSPPPPNPTTTLVPQAARRWLDRCCFGLVPPRLQSARGHCRTPGENRACYVRLRSCGPRSQIARAACKRIFLGYVALPYIPVRRTLTIFSLPPQRNSVFLLIWGPSSHAR